MRSLIVGLLAFAVLGCGISTTATLTAVTKTTAAATLPTKPAEQMSDAELIAAYREYEKEHETVKNQWVMTNMVVAKEKMLAKTPRTELENVFSEMSTATNRYMERVRRVQQAEAMYARSWQKLSLKLLPAIPDPKLMTMDELTKKWELAQGRQGE